MLRNILLGLGLFAVLFSVLIFSGKISIGKGPNEPIGEVVLWGTFPEEPMNALTQAFNPQAKTYAVRYKYIPESDFNQRLLEALASGQGPDMILAPYQTILYQAERLYPFSITEKDYKDTFVDGSSIFFTPQGAMALPVSIEPMVMFYNRALFSKHSIVNPPAFWTDVVTTVPLITIKQNGRFVESAIALGTPNTPYAKDIMMAIVGQLGQIPVLRQVGQDGAVYYDVLANEPVQEGGQVYPLASTARFFSQFGDPGQTTYTWSQSQEGSASDVFVAEKLAMYIGYSGEFNVLKARNPRGEFEMTYLPQSKDQNTFTTGMRLYGLATLRTTKNPKASIAVQQQFSSSGVAPTLSAIVGGVPPLRAYAGSPNLPPVIAKSMLVARGWYDKYEKDSTIYTQTMISDIINYRYGVSDAVGLYVSRLRDLYVKK